VLEHMVMGVKIVVKGNTAMAVILLRSRAEIAQPGTTAMALVKVLAYHAYPANSTILPVPTSANLAKRILFQATKIEPCLVIHAPPERHRSKEASDAIEPPAKRAPSKTLLLEHAQSVHKVGHRMSWMPQSASGAHLAPPHWPTEAVRCVLGAILENMAMP
jgi:hypothetical protein